MKQKKLNSKFDWQLWQSDGDDLRQMDASVIKRILFHMFVINEFEHAVLRLKNDDCVWGPVHSSVGQEAVAAASIATLRKTDRIAGTHRAHHQFLSKVMSYVLPDEWDPCADALTEPAEEVVRRTLAEIMGLAPGYCGGRGGSMHLCHPDAGVIGTNAIVGGGIPIATGAAFAEKLRNTGDIVVCFFGDGAVNQGVFHEAANLAAIWDLPVLYFIENNLYAVGTCAKQACACQDLSLHAEPYGMSALVVDGMDPAAIYAAMSHLTEQIRCGGRPCILEAKCYRHYHHAGDQPGSAYGYRGRVEEEEWLKKDAVVAFPDAVVKAGVMDLASVDCIRDKAKTAVMDAVDYCTLPTTPPSVARELWPRKESLLTGVRSDGREWTDVKFSEIEGFVEFDTIHYSDAIAAVTGRWLDKDNAVVVLGEEVASFGGGAYGATKGLPAKYPDRVLNTPISESGFVGLACGAAMSGLKPVVEIMFPDFALVAADQLFNQIARLRYMYGGDVDIPIVVRTRIAIGCGYGGQHSMDPVALYALFPGWRIVVPSNAFDYIGLFNSAMTSLDPVLVVEHHSLYRESFPMPQGNLDYFIRFGKAKVAQPGVDVTMITYGAAVHKCLQARNQLDANGISAEVIDLRTVDLPSIDYDTIGTSVSKTGIVVIVEEAPASQSLGGVIAAEITERFFDQLDGPVIRIASANVSNPVSRVLESAAVLSVDEIAASTASAARRCR